MQSDQTDQVQKILRMESKDFLCSLKRNLLCPADDFLYLPEMGGDQAPYEVSEGVDRIMFLLELPDTVNKEFQGKFFDENKVTPLD